MDIGKDVLKNYVPAVVYTLYDGYYIYSPYTNILDNTNKNEIIINPATGENDFKSDAEILNSDNNNATYKQGDEISGLKPYIYYSCRYKKENSDFIITYSLDSYITIQGVLNGEPVNKSGYLLTGVGYDENEGVYTYRGIKILQEDSLLQNVYEENSNSVNGTDVIIKDEAGNEHHTGKIVSYPCRKINGVKYYYNESKDEVFSIINDVKYNQSSIPGNVIKYDQNAVNYYKNAYELKKYIENNDVLRNLNISDSIDSQGNYYTNSSIYTENPFFQYGKLFAELFNTSGTYIEDSNSKFNSHRLEVIKNSIESNLMVAIANYNKISTSEVNFQMPKLQDYEWEQITDNISMITFLQGFNIGGKIYNGHSIISNNINEEYVSEDSIYFSNGIEYKKATDSTLLQNNIENIFGVFNVDFERKTGQVFYKKNIVDETGNVIGNQKIDKTIYYYPRNELGSYNSIVDSNSSLVTNNINEYMKNLTNDNPVSQEYKLAQKYYTALGREREGIYRGANILEDIQEGLRIQSLGGKFENDYGKVYDYFPPGYKLDNTKTVNGNNHIVKI